MSETTKLLFDSSKSTSLKNWRIVDDVVMGGRSNGSVEFAPQGHLQFSGTISLENNGGFSSLRYDCPNTSVDDKSAVRVRLKGDGKQYQFRVRHKNDRHSFITYFETNGDWQSVEFTLRELYPTFRGRRLDLPDFNHNSISEIGFLIGNKKAESFSLLIEKIELVST
jgi:hypothetical protein